MLRASVQTWVIRVRIIGHGWNFHTDKKHRLTQTVAQKTCRPFRQSPKNPHLCPMRQILLYGLILGASLFLIQYMQYRFVFIQHTESLYTGIVAAVCCVAGIWAGITLTRRWQGKTAANNTEKQELAGFTRDEAAIERYNITPREFEVLELIAQGLSNQQIAEKLYLSLNTVKTHTSNVFAKLDVQRRTQAIQKAKEIGLLR